MIGRQPTRIYANDAVRNLDIFGFEGAPWKKQERVNGSK